MEECYNVASVISTKIQGDNIIVDILSLFICFVVI